MAYTYLIPQVPTDKNHIQAGATGLAIRLQIKEGNSAINLSTVTVKNIIIEKPDATLVSGSASFVTDGTDGIIYYISGSADLTQTGEYHAQAYLEMPGFSGYTTPVDFAVYSNLPIPEEEEDAEYL